MPVGLRERKRLAAVRAIRERALDLFDERGFDAVTVEEIAAAAEVSPSTVYRHFGGKEGLILPGDPDGLAAPADLADLADLVGLTALADLAGPDVPGGMFDPDDPIGTVRRVVARYESAAAGADPAGGDPWRRMRYLLREPSVRPAVHAWLGRVSERIATGLVTGRGMPATRARVTAHAFVFGCLAALEQWQREGGARPMSEHVDEGMAVLRGVWPGSAG